MQLVGPNGTLGVCEVSKTCVNGIFATHVIGFPVVGTLTVTEDVLVSGVAPSEIVGVNPLHAPSQITYAEVGVAPNGILPTVTVTEPDAFGLLQLKLPSMVGLHVFVAVAETVALVPFVNVPGVITIAAGAAGADGMAVAVPVVT